MLRFNVKDHAKTFISGFRRLESIRYSDQELTPNNWCEEQPCLQITIASRQVILTQPSSTIFVYLLGLLTIGVGLYFLWIRGAELSRLWWGVSLLLWGIGALLAGTSYQAFGYEIKCAGRSSCAWTSWWEVVYLMFQYISMSAMLVAFSYSSTTGSLQTALLVYALVSSLLYIVVTLIGGLIPVKALVTFNLMVRVSTPIFLFMLVLTGWRYSMFGTSMDLALLGCWILLLLTSTAYYLYDEFDITTKLWNRGKGFWFSQNDILHLGLILWMIYIAVVVAHQIHDL